MYFVMWNELLRISSSFVAATSPLVENEAVVRQWGDVPYLTKLSSELRSQRQACEIGTC